jgi:hypothetical protein
VGVCWGNKRGYGLWILKSLVWRSGLQIQKGFARKYLVEARG